LTLDQRYLEDIPWRISSIIAEIICKSQEVQPKYTLMRQQNLIAKNIRRSKLSLTKLKTVKPDRSISYLCRRGSHEGNSGKAYCKGRSCSCSCHEYNPNIIYCMVCDKRRVDGDNQICAICSGAAK